MSESINQSEEYQKLKVQYDKLNADWLALDKENEILKKQNQNLKWGMERYQRCVDDVSKQEGKYNAMTHEQMAGEVRMLDRMQLSHEAVCCAARDRIIYLADLVADLTEVVEQTLPQNLLVIDSLKFGSWYANLISKTPNLQMDMPNFILNEHRVHLGEVKPKSIKINNSGFSGNFSGVDARHIVVESSASNLNSHGEERIGDGLLNLGHQEHMKSLKTMSVHDFGDVLNIGALTNNEPFYTHKEKRIRYAQFSPAQRLLEKQRLRNLNKTKRK